jgi:hypothetical protein
VDRPVHAQLHVSLGQFFEDVTGVRQRPREPVQFGDDEGVAGAAGGHRFAESGSVPVGAGQALVGVDPASANAECDEGVSLGGEILLFCGHACVSD